MATRYQQGRDTEYAAIEVLEKMGYEARRTGASKGKYDVIATCAHWVRFIQTKRYTDRPGSYAKDIGQLQAMPIPPCATTEIWLKQAGQRGWQRRVIKVDPAYQPPHSLLEPCHDHVGDREEPSAGLDQASIPEPPQHHAQRAEQNTRPQHDRDYEGC